MSARLRAKSESKVAAANSSGSMRGRLPPFHRENVSTPVKKGKVRISKPKHYCLCNGIDDGTPMVQCAHCKDWYHFRCLNMSERDFAEIDVYICPPCSANTGRRTVMEWEGPEALEQAPPDDGPNSPSELEAIPSESENPSSEDEYVAEEEISSKTKRRLRRLTVSSETRSSDSESGGDVEVEKRKVRRVGRAGMTKATNAMSMSPPPEPHERTPKRKAHTVIQPPPKRKRSISLAGNIDTDPARKYCLAKYEEIFVKIFLRYPHELNGQEMEDQENLNDEKKSRMQAEGKKFASELEQCVFEVYGERDKDGNLAALGKYKDRFRTLSFNLTKDDRVFIHKRIASGSISPKELAVISSTDLANEETKQSIKVAEEVALAHSILQKSKVPLAKITHKGLQDIEHEGEEVGSLRAREQEQNEEEERREYERLARLREGRQRRPSVASPITESHPPMSPVISQPSPTRHGPSTILQPDHAEISPSSPAFTHLTPASPTATAPASPVANLMTVDDQPSEQQVTPEAPATVASDVTSAQPATSQTDMDATPPAVPQSPTILAVSKTDPPEQPTSSWAEPFDLSSFWNAQSEPPTIRRSSSPPPQQPEGKDHIIGPDILEEADDKDFDMLLDEKEPGDKPPTIPSDDGGGAMQAKFDALPPVWHGKITMPLDSIIPKEAPVVARQIGGRKIDHASLLWKTLFPLEMITVAGRVPVDQSSNFLLQSRLNSTKELVSVAFSPATADDPDFKILSDFLIAKNRHGLIFPWGQRPKEHHPGKELYLIPLLSHDPLPEYMELLDDFQLPTTRKHNYLVGIWILNKGKLVPPHQPSIPPPPPQLPPSIVNAPPPLPPSLQPPLFGVPPAQPMGIPGTLPSLPGSYPQPGPYPPPTQSGLEALVAALTPEQISLMLQKLTSGQPLPSSAIPPQPTAVVPPQPAVPQQWAPQSFPPFLPPPHVPQTPQAAVSSHSPYPYQQAYEQDRDYLDQRGRQAQGRGGDRGRGWRGSGRGRGRGGREHRDRSPLRPVDSGWPRRERPDGAGGSPSQGRWA